MAWFSLVDRTLAPFSQTWPGPICKQNGPWWQFWFFLGGVAGLVHSLRIGPCCQLFPLGMTWPILDPVSGGLFPKDLHDLVHTGSCCQLLPEAGLVQSYRLDPASVWFVQEYGWLGPFLTDWTLLSVIPRV